VSVRFQHSLNYFELSTLASFCKYCYEEKCVHYALDCSPASALTTTRFLPGNSIFCTPTTHYCMCASDGAGVRRNFFYSLSERILLLSLFCTNALCLHFVCSAFAFSLLFAANVRSGAHSASLSLSLCSGRARATGFFYAHTHILHTDNGRACV